MKTITENSLNKLYRYLSECDSFVFLDTSKPDERNSTSMLFTRPLERVQFYQGGDEREFLDTVQQLKEEGKYLAGWFSYEFGYLLESSLKQRLQRDEDDGRLLADLGVFTGYHRFDHVTGVTDFPIEDIEEREPGNFTVSNLQYSQRREEYIHAINTILEYISAGDTYQVNYTLKLFFDFFGSPEGFYADLRRNQSVGYGAYIRWKNKRVMSFSPELFFWKGDSDVMVRPMKGTLTRGRTPDEDAQKRDFLRNDVKNQSENVMIVDLLRNDLGRLMHHMDDGDVQVDSLFDVETYETLLQMTSTITGKTDRNIFDSVSLYTFFKAIFPCGSITGAPKIRTMEIIEELEGGRRGIYTGAIGYISPRGEAVFNVPIRTVVLDGERGEMGIGSGIVHDSVPEKEWEECLLKGRFLTKPRQPFALIETLHYHVATGFFLLQEHLHRLENSAQFFLFSCDLEKIKNDLFIYVQQFRKRGVRVRLTLQKDGRYAFTGSECDPVQSLTLPIKSMGPELDLPKIGVSLERIDSNSCWCFHKTTNRELYNREYAVAKANGWYDSVFCNEEGNITEGCITNIFLYSNGTYCTPPVMDGLLPGVMRQHLLDTCREVIVEKNVSLADLERAEALFLCNSVRGVVQVTL